MSSSGLQEQSGRLLVLTYHYVREKGGPYAGIHPISAVDLSQQIQKLKQHFHPAAAQEVEAFAKGEKVLKRDSFFITFDDGLLDHFEAARKILNDHNLKGAFFVSTRPFSDLKAPAVHKVHWLRATTEPKMFLNLLNQLLPAQWSNMELTKDQREQAAQMHIHDEPTVQAIKYTLNFLVPYDVVDRVTSLMLEKKGMTEEQFCRMTFMSEDHLAVLASEGHIIGLHGHDHAPLSMFDDKQQDSDIAKNASILENIIGVRPAWLSYPYGRPDALPRIPETLCNRHKLSVAFTLISGINEEGIHGSVLRRITPNELDNYMH
jgi:peptidoglycan/xylan/chitin deacetylase (PgdA/CDA1 family)